MQRPHENLFISGDRSRLFLNLELGCNSSCSYCYLPPEGLQLGKRPVSSLARSPEELLHQLQADGRFVSGRDGTILSIGCFSECWDSATRPRTIRLIQGLLAFDNWIQFATKREIRQVDLLSIIKSPDWRMQAVAYISSATISQWAKFERGTTPPERRFRSFSACKASGVRSCLYVKPVLPGVTILDVDLYGSLMRTHRMDVVVGDLFIPGAPQGEASSPISLHLRVSEHADASLIRATLAESGRVFGNSTTHLLQE